MYIYTGEQIKGWDSYTMEHEPIASIDLMERAATALTAAIAARYGKEHPVVVFAGPGNNGGDALAVARLLAVQGYAVEVFLFNTRGTLSADCATNRQRLHDCTAVARFVEVRDTFLPPVFTAATVVVDGLFGVGLSRPLDGGFAALVKFINASAATVVSLDMPSGLFTEDNTQNIPQHVVRASLTLTLAQKKLAMYLADNAHYLGEVQVVDIGLSQEYLAKFRSIYSLVEEQDIRALLRRRTPFAHKGMMGHALLIAGAYGICGAAVLAARACLRAGVGKVTVHSPAANNDILQGAVPEAVVHHDSSEAYFSDPVAVDDYDAVALGPGVGQHEATAAAVMEQIRNTSLPMVLDADALNILAMHRSFLRLLPANTILTPHPAECDRLAAATTTSSYARLRRTAAMAARLHLYIVLKGHYTALCCPDGETYFNPTGNAGMATAGAGDVLTGIILALLARGYNAKEACLVGVYVHGLAGDRAAAALSQECLVASDIIAALPHAFKQLYTQE